MNVFAVVKENVTARQVAMQYGIKINRSGLACCPFHKDKTPSMKIDKRYYCFGCGDTGDAIDFVAKYFGLAPKEAAMKIASDFGLNYDATNRAPPKKMAPKKTPEQILDEEQKQCFCVLSDYYHLLRKWKTEYAPKSMDEEWHELDLGDIGRRKTALFVIISDTDDSLNFLVSIMYTQLFNLLCTIADDEYHGKLPVHVRCILDEFANIGQIPKFDKLIATIRSREISASIILQSKAQLKSIYKDNAETIEGNCDTFLFLGGKEKSTLKDLSEVLGKETIDTYNTSDTRGTSQSYGLNYQKLGRELMSQDRLALMDGGKCILQVRGVRPFFSDKVDITANEMYKELSDFDKKNQFDIEKYVSEYGKPKFSKII